MKRAFLVFAAMAALAAPALAEDFPKPYDRHCTERENVFEFAKKPSVRLVAKDKYEIAFATKGYCDVTAGIIDEKGVVVRHLASGVLGKNAPSPFQKDSLTQKITWNGKNDLDSYVKEPGKMRVRVMLGLKPIFNRHLNGTSPHNLPANIFGLAADSTGVYVFTRGGRGKNYVRKFGLDGEYLYSLAPPPSKIPEAKLSGRGYVEFESGRRASHGPSVYVSTADHGHLLPWLGKLASDQQALVIGDRLFFVSDGHYVSSTLYYIYTDGASDRQGLKGRPFAGRTAHFRPRLAASPDGKWIYMTGCGSSSGQAIVAPYVLRFATDGKGPGKVFVGDPKAPGKDNAHFGNPQGIACDRQGRIYVCDQTNNRIQVFSAEGKHLKTISIERPDLVSIHEKTGALYVHHVTRVKGKSVERLSKLVSFDNPRVVAHADGPHGLMALDSWSPKPRLWFSNGSGGVSSGGYHGSGRHVVTVWEEDGATFKPVLDFEKKAKKDDKDTYAFRWGGSALGAKVVCDPTRERAYYANSHVFDLPTGRHMGRFGFRKVDGPSIGRNPYDDIAFDKRGYMHIHFNPGFNFPGVARVDPGQAKVQGVHAVGNVATYPEMPYDYGIFGREERGQSEWTGILPVKDQPGAKFFQDGIGVNMRGDIAEQCNIYNVPKMDEYFQEFLFSFAGDNSSRKEGFIGKNLTYAAIKRRMQEQELKGQAAYFIRRRPGIPLVGGTVWTFDRSGELRRECAVLAGDLINGTQLDEDGSVYFINARTRLYGKNPFLWGQSGTFGAPEDEDQRNMAFTGTLIKTKPHSAGQRCEVVTESAPVPLDEMPKRPADLLWIEWAGKGGQSSWMEGAEWMYAGASPIVSNGCSCPTSRFHLDWYKRSWVPEAYRRSIGVVDTAGNLVMHVGRHGNRDDALAMKPGSEDVTLTFVRFVSGTDNYLCLEDNGEGLTVLKLEYHAEEIVPIQTN
ncbi:hypothetical protein ACFL01_01060 [Planctomycetota bacterium]